MQGLQGVVSSEAMDLALIVLLKCAVVGAWFGIIVAWEAYRAKRRREGLPMKQNPRTGVYYVSDWTAWVNRAAIWGRNAVWGSIVLMWAVFGAIYVYSGKEGLTAFVQSWFY